MSRLVGSNRASGCWFWRLSALAACVGLLLVWGGCARRPPATPAKDKGADTKAPASPTVDKPGVQGSTGVGTKGPVADTGTANTAKGKAAPVPAGEASKSESPFPGQAGVASPQAGPAGQGGSPGSEPAVVVLRDPDRIPGVPRVPLPDPKRSPFRVQGAEQAAKPVGETPPAQPDLAKTPKEFSTVRPLPPIPVGSPPVALHGSEGPGGVSRPEVRPEAPAVPVFYLTGIISGEPPMALIEGEKARYIVREGDLVAGGFRVASILPQKVILLSRDSRSLVLRFGRRPGGSG